MYYLYGRSLVFCHFLIDITFYYKINYHSTSLSFQCQTCMQEKLHLSADFVNAIDIGEVGVSHTSVLISLVQKIASKITTQHWVGRIMEFHTE